MFGNWLPASMQLHIESLLDHYFDNISEFPSPGCITNTLPHTLHYYAGRRFIFTSLLRRASIYRPVITIFIFLSFIDILILAGFAWDFFDILMPLLPLFWPFLFSLILFSPLFLISVTLLATHYQLTGLMACFRQPPSRNTYAYY